VCREKTSGENTHHCALLLYEFRGDHSYILVKKPAKVVRDKRQTLDLLGERF